MIEFNKIALTRYPNEAGAVIIGGVLFEVRNVSPEPTRFMEFSAQEVLELELQYGPVEKYLHSHPYDSSKPVTDYRYKPQWPSHQDMVVWIALNKPFGIVATDGTGCSEVFWLDDDNRPPLEGREFEHGTQDCYSAIRDWFWMERGINLKNFPRGWDWWSHGENLYIDGFPKAGFVEIPRAQATTGDVIIYQIGATAPNHAAIMVGPTAILHHLIDRKSRVEPRAKWQRAEVMAVRFTG